MRLLHAAGAALLIVGMSSAARAQPGSHTHTFTPLPEVTVDGVIERVEPVGPDECEACLSCAECAGTHLVVRKTHGRVDVHLAPAWFLERCGFVFAPGDVVSVTGTRANSRRHEVIVARNVRRDGIVMKFRDEHGLPLWRRELTVERTNGRSR